jgi:hypothetical protein
VETLSKLHAGIASMARSGVRQTPLRSAARIEPSDREEALDGIVRKGNGLVIVMENKVASDGVTERIDLLAFNPETKRVFQVQVKTVRKKNIFPISHAKVDPTCTYVFAVLHAPGEAVQYFVVPGTVLAYEKERFVPRWFCDPKFPGIGCRTLEEQGFSEAWKVFSDPMR